MAKPSLELDLHLSQEEDFQCGQSKIGGLPHLPPHINWEAWQWRNSPLHFIGQINLNEINTLGIDFGIPPTGLLSFFYPIDDEPVWKFTKRTRSCRVLYTAKTEKLKIQKPPKMLQASPYSVLPRSITFKKLMTLPEAISIHIEELNLSAQELQAYHKLMHNTREETFVSRIFGYSGTVDPDGFTPEIKSELIFQDIQLESQDPHTSTVAAQKRQDPLVKKGSKAWNLLLQLAPLEEEELYWGGDLGKLNFLCRQMNFRKMRQQDIAFFLEDE
ncbi:MAG: DUF1963 domain-containing protein [Candidatus Sericytochromatia bacterium]